MATQEEYSAEETRKKMESLPEEVKNLLYSPEMLTTIREVGEKNQLHIDQIGTLQTETSSVMLGFTESQDFPKMISQALNIDISKANAIAKDINDELFVKIRNSMKSPVATNIAEKIANPPAMSAVPAAEGKSVVMPSSLAKTIGGEMAHTTPAVTPAQISPSAPLAEIAAPTPAPVPAPIVMPVQVVIPAATTPVPVQATTPMAPTSKPTGMPTIPKVDTVLSEPTVSIAPKPITDAPAVPTINASALTAEESSKGEVPKPGPIYKTDPYHEPID